MSLSKLTIATRYSKAFFQLVSEHNQVQEVQAELHELQKVFEDNVSLAPMLSDKGLKHETKVAMLRNLTDNASLYVKNLLQMVFDYGRINNLLDIISEFDKLCDQSAGIVRADLTTAIAIEDDQLSRMAQQFSKRVGAKKVIFNSKVDSSIIGGAIIQTNSLIYDGSISTQINQIKQQLLG